MNNETPRISVNMSPHSTGAILYSQHIFCPSTTAFRSIEV